MDQSSEDRPESARSAGFGARIHRISQYIVRNPIRTAQIGFFVLIAIVILQNLESTSIDILFWTIASLPKLVVIFLSMVVGAAAWELTRRLMR